MNTKRLSFKLWRYESKKIEGDLLYESEEQVGQKAFQFCDSMINQKLVSQQSYLFVLEIYENENMLGKTKTIDFKHLKNSTKGVELYDNKGKEVPAKLEVQYSERKPKTFLDYISEGLRLSMIISIDFTSSNINCNEKESLHYIGSEERNTYEDIIFNIGNILTNYDEIQEFSVFGFGGIFPSKDEVSHSFFVNSKNDQFTKGLENVLQEYRQVLPKIRLLGPTYFRFFLKNIIEKVKKSMSNNEKIYFLSLILTDGLINDMEETIDLFVDASKLPISFIIVGVGDEDFGNMHILGKLLLTSRSY
jgi:hypothetical protein